MFRKRELKSKCPTSVKAQFISSKNLSELGPSSQVSAFPEKPLQNIQGLFELSSWDPKWQVRNPGTATQTDSACVSFFGGMCMGTPPEGPCLPIRCSRSARIYDAQWIFQLLKDILGNKFCWTFKPASGHSWKQPGFEGAPPTKKAKQP